jgi:hypothetical protein
VEAAQPARDIRGQRRHLELPTPVCRSVLLAISAGDTRRQRELNAGQHLLRCEICETLSEPLDRRSIALTAIAIPGGLAAWAAGKARSNPVQATAVGAAASAAVAAGVVLGLQPSAPVPPRAAHVAASPAPARPAPVPVISNLSVAGRALTDAEAGQSLRSLVGRTANASGATVVDAVTRNGFWIGSSRGRIWVELVGPLRPLSVRAGDRVWFSGSLVGNSASDPALAGLTGGDAALLARQGAHLAVSTTRILVGR